MPPEERSKRAYDAPRRRAQAMATRATVVVAARELFVDRGYAATTIAAVAARAGVSSETVYAVFGTKRGLLEAVVDASIAGDAEPVPVLERPWVEALREEPDVERRVRMLAQGGRAILERIAPIHRMLAGAAGVEPAAAEVLERYAAQRFEGQRALVRIVIDDAPMRQGVSMRAAVDTAFAIGSPETYRLLVEDRGWTPVRFERWYADTMIRLLLPGA
jgi:AcrR family transcriptional regulator